MVLAEKCSRVAACSNRPNLHNWMREQQPEKLSACITCGASHRGPYSHPHEYAIVDNFMHISVSRAGRDSDSVLPQLQTVAVYSMRMARVNITVPDEVIVRARTAKLNISRIATAALVEELDRLVKLAELDAYLAELEAERGPITDEEAAEGRAWLDAVLAAPPVSEQHSGAA
jgi:hypothetical protein